MYNTGLRYNTGERYNTIPIYTTSQFYMHLAHALPLLVNEELQVLRMLSNAFEIYTDETLQGEERLTFKLPYEAIFELQPEALIEFVGRIYRVVNMNIKEDDNGRIFEVDAWVRWYDLAKGLWLDRCVWANATVVEVVGYLLQTTGWRISTSTITGSRGFRWDGGCNRLEALRQVERLYNAELVWDSVTRSVSIVPAGGVDRGLYFLRGKNLLRVETEMSTADTVYRLYARGKGGLTFAAINQGKDYVEIVAPYNPPPSAFITEERITTPEALLEYTNAVFATRNQKRVSYQCEIIDISALSGVEEEQIRLGDVVTVYDEEINLHLTTRVVKMRYDVEAPWRSAIELATPTLDLATIILEMHQEKVQVEEQVEERIGEQIEEQIEEHIGEYVDTYLDEHLPEVMDYLPLAGGIMEGNIDMATHQIQQADIINYAEVLHTETWNSDTQTIDLNNGNVFNITLADNVTSLSIVNVRAQCHSFTVILFQGSPARTISWPTTVKWNRGSSPDMTKIDTVHVLTFMTLDTGSSWYGFVAGSEFS